jgi:hypothetical protein
VGFVAVGPAPSAVISSALISSTANRDAAGANFSGRNVVPQLLHRTGSNAFAVRTKPSCAQFGQVVASALGTAKFS